MPKKKLKPFGMRTIKLGKSTLVLRPAKLSDAKSPNERQMRAKKGVAGVYVIQKCFR